MTSVVEALADLIRRHYLFADRAESLARQVEDWATGPIAEQQSAEKLATTMTELLQEATNDGHFKVMEKVFTPEELAAAPELGTVHWRDGTTETLWSNPDRASFQFDPDVGLVMVIGQGTASGGEALADHLQAPGRALVVDHDTNARHPVTPNGGCQPTARDRHHGSADESQPCDRNTATSGSSSGEP